MRGQPLGDFLALRPAGPLDEIGALAMRCVAYFDNLRAPPTPAELAKHRHAGLTARQESLLRRWGYPYTEEEFRFHMTLTDSLAGIDEDAIYALRKAADECFAAAAKAGPLAIDALTVFREEQSGAPFSLWRRFPFQGWEQEASLPASGRLFFLVGPSGAGKDTLLQWLQQHIGADAGVVFARRTITRPTHPSESHQPVDTATFWQLAAAGHFSMMWQANGLCYGIPRGIETDLKAGRDVIINGSREYLPQLRKLFPHAQVIWIEADAGKIRQRIESRQREAGAALLKRLERAMQFTPPQEEDVIRLDNSGPVEVAGRRMLEILAKR
jgi:ribose 1,5-bisphosphokinase